MSKKRLAMVAVMFCGVVMFASSSIAGTVGQWTFNDGSGSTIADSSGYGNNGTITWAGSWSTDSPFEPNPANNSLGGLKEVQVANASVLNPTGDFTIESWVKFGSLGGNPFIVSKRGLGGAATTGYFIEFYGNTFAFATGNGSSWSSTAATVANLATDVWYHVAGVHTAIENILYVNGVSNGGNGTLAMTGNTAPLTFGYYAAGDKYGDFANDDVRLSNAALTVDQLGYYAALPEPATLSLLAIGAIALYRKR